MITPFVASNCDVYCIHHCGNKYENIHTILAIYICMLCADGVIVFMNPCILLSNLKHAALLADCLCLHIMHIL